MKRRGETERILLDLVRETGLCDVRFDAEAVALDTDSEESALVVRRAGIERTIRARYVVGSDGASSFVRGALGLPFEGMTYALRPMLADVRVGDARDGLPWPRFNNAGAGLRFTLRLRPGVWRVISLDQARPDEAGQVSDEEVRACTAELLGDGPVEVVWSSRFRIHLRSSPTFRRGRVLLAGDAAHVHSPVGGMGMNAGIHDADNLAWKLAAALAGGDVDRLLDSYDVERRAVAVEHVSRLTDLMTRGFVLAPAAVRAAAFLAFRAAMRVPFLRRPILRGMTMIDLGYPASPILDRRDRAAGVRLPNPLLSYADGRTVRLYDLLPAGPVLLKVGQIGEPETAMPVSAVVHIGRDPADATGSIRALLGHRNGWILVRPDSYIAWARSHGQDLDRAVRHALGMRERGH